MAKRKERQVSGIAQKAYIAQLEEKVKRSEADCTRLKYEFKQRLDTIELTIQNSADENKELRFKVSDLESETSRLREQNAELSEQYTNERDRGEKLERALQNSQQAQERYREMIKKRTDAQARMSRELYEGRRASMAATLMSTMSRTLSRTQDRAHAAVREADILMLNLGMRKPQ